MYEGMLNAGTEYTKLLPNRPVRLFLLKTQDDEDEFAAQGEASDLGEGRINKSTTVGSSISKSESASFENHC